MDDMFNKYIEQFIKSRDAPKVAGLLGSIDDINRQAFANLESAPKQPAQQVQAPQGMTLSEIPAYLDQNYGEKLNAFTDKPIRSMQAPPQGTTDVLGYIDQQAALRRRLMGF